MFSWIERSRVNETGIPRGLGSNCIPEGAFYGVKDDLAHCGRCSAAGGITHPKTGAVYLQRIQN